MPSEFHAAPWDAPLDVEACLAAIPKGAMIKGMFILPMIGEAQRRNVPLKTPRHRYLPFFDYPLVEHARLLVAAARALFPDVSLREGLRKLGRAALAVFLETTVGKVVWAGAADMDAALEAVAKGYAITSSLTRITVVERGEGHARLRLDGVHGFLDSHHVGLFEGILRACNLKGTVTIRLDSPSSGELLLAWRE